MSNHNTKPTLSAHHQLLLKSIYDQEFLNDLPFLSLHDYQLQGVMTVDPLERNTVLGLTNDDLPAQRFFHEETRALFMENEHFVLTGEDPSFDYTLGYDGTGKNGNEEALSLVLTCKHQHETIGFFKFAINHSMAMLNDHYIKIRLEKLHVLSEHQNQPHWLDLICGVRTFLSVMSECLINTVNEGENLMFYLTDDYKTDDGKNVGGILRSELCVILEELAINYPQKTESFSNKVMHMDSSVY